MTDWTLPPFDDYTTVPASLDDGHNWISVDQQIAYNEGADITDGATDDEK